MTKTYKLPDDKITRLIPHMGGAFATDMITIEGKKVDYMTRGEPSREGDSGWVFYGGGETQAYMDDSSNTGLFDLNTIANYDSDIIEFLTYPAGTEIERNKEGKLEVLNKDIEKPEVILFHPAHKGVVQLTSDWSMEINDLLLRRFDQGSLVLWRPKFTIWLNVFNADSSIESRVEKAKETIDKNALQFKEELDSNLSKLSYQLDEDGQSSYYVYAFSEKQDIYLSIYYDDESHLEEINNIRKTLMFKHVD